ncbi:hypothetical protein CKM354_001001400 [Cercospora kikuchii]|uniref:Methyltransferase domain-containing protein n=1 Tax=Cercospora kikuchii TaxID=84275 RepID=A0A9P3FGR1_9PEZI|nr:uncharacterized protein CKM354_001001400 [Cercospora kikuchii]GIZ46908.1 hypothetical protein CKM354_001001400 [Cercospora kikuchii]
MSSTITLTESPATKMDAPFATTDTDTKFWQDYISFRPSPSEDFFQLINEYHDIHGNTGRGIAHDVGTGPGNIATRLANYYIRVVGSDVNAKALAAAPTLTSEPTLSRMTFVQSPAEQLSSGVVPEEVGNGKTDLVVVSECMPLLDRVKSIEAFRTLLRPSGTLAIYFYGRPLFADGGDRTELNDLYDSIATRICTFLLPFIGSPAEAFHLRAAETMGSWMDNIGFDAREWESVQRYKWNSNVDLLFNSRSGYDFELKRVDRRGEGETTTEKIDSQHWQHEWDVEDIANYLASVYPNYREKAGQRYSDIETMLSELKKAMGGKRKVTFPVSLILATKKGN